MPPKHENPLKNRGFKLSDETMEQLKKIADYLSEATGMRAGMSDALRISVAEKHAKITADAPEPKKPKK